MASTAINIDRPLDEIVKERRTAKRKEQKEKRQKEREARESKNTTDTKPSGAGAGAGAGVGADFKQEGPTPAKESLKVKGGIRKKRRSRGVGAGGDNKRTDNDVDRKVEKKSNAGGGGGDGSTSARKPNKGAKVSVFNLDHGVTQSDITELFETVGPLRSARLIILADGRSSGSAEVVFENMDNALQAIQRYNNVPLDNRPLKITLASASAPIRLSRGRRPGRRERDREGGTRRDDSPADRDGDRRGNGANTANNARDFDKSPVENEDNARDRFDDSRVYSRRNGRRSRNSRSYERRGASPNEQMFD